MNRLIHSGRTRLLLLMMLAPCVSSATVTFTDKIASSAEVMIDVREESQCLERALADSLCLPAEHLFGGHNRLANFSGMFWLLGTLGLTGTEHVVIAGDKSDRREFVAGWLYVAGQSQVDVITRPVSSMLSETERTHPGRARASTRTAVFLAQPRTQLLVLKSEMVDAIDAMQSPVLLDGRSEAEYWGWSVRASRGGHLPGAQHAPMPSSYRTATNTMPIAYAHDAVSGLAYLARLISQRIDAKLYLGGWIEWASDSNLPVDAESFYTRRPVSPTREIVSAGSAMAEPQIPGDSFALTLGQGLIVILILLSLVVVAWLLGRVRRIAL